MNAISCWRVISLLVVLLNFTSVFSCTDSAVEQDETNGTTAQKVLLPAFQELLNEAQVAGAVLVYDEQANTYYSNDFDRCLLKTLPASTFKIPNSIIGLELGILADENTIFKWDSTPRAMSIWEKDLKLKDAFQTSCVPCYQALARTIGVERMQKKVAALKFGQMDIHNDNIDRFWLLGQSEIDQFEQIDFLSRFYHNQLPVKSTTQQTMKSILQIETSATHSLSGKTGLVVRGGTDIGWFVGYLEKGDKLYFFATRIEPAKDTISRAQVQSMRRSLTRGALQILEVL